MYNHTHRLQINAAGTTPRTPTARKLQRFLFSTLLLGAGFTASPAFAAVAPPSVPNLADASDSGVSKTDNITNVTQPTFTGTGTPLSTVTLYAGANAVGFAIVPPSGQWTLAPNAKLKDGAYAITVRQTTGGVQSAPSATLGVVIDTVAPTTPSFADMIDRSDHGTSNTDDVTNTTTPIFQNIGVGAQGDFIALYNVSISNQLPIGMAPIDSHGEWKCAVTTPFPSGTHTYLVTAEARDRAGNLSPQSGGRQVVIDTQRPMTASTPDLVDDDDSGVSKSDNITFVTLPRFKVNTEPEGKVALYTAGVGDGTLIGTAVADNTGTATIKATKPLTGNYVYAVNFDKAGNQALNSTPVLDVTIDTEDPITPDTPVLAAKSDSGVIGDNITNVKTPVIEGHSADINDTFYLVINNMPTSAKPSKVDPTTHRWSITAPPLPEGKHDISVIAVDRAGNTSFRPTPLHLTIDTTPPPAPSGLDLLASDDTGSNITDNITNKTTLNFDGLSQPALKIVIYNNGLKIAETITNAQGIWKATATGVKPGPLHITAASFDIAGNASVSSKPLVGMLDVSAPDSTLTTPSNSFTQNLDTLSGTSLDSTVNGDASGVAKVSMRITRLSTNTNWSGSQWAGPAVELPVILGNGKWSKTTGLPLLGDNPLTQLQDGDYTITLTTSDIAGNVRVGGRTITVDSGAPAVTILQPTQDAILKGVLSLNVNGNASDNNAITRVKVSLQRRSNNVMYYWNGSAFVTTPSSVDATVTSPGSKDTTWTCSDQLPHDSDLKVGIYVLYAAAYDNAGNMRMTPARTFSITSGDPVPADASGSAGAS